jgi:DNA end-binding protein Ku
MSRMIWKGAISFGLVHVPVGLYPASQDSGIDFDWLDKRSMDPVGYKRVNKRTGREIDKDDIVKGIKQKDGEYVVLSDDEIRAAYPKTTQTIEIETFVKEGEIPFVYLDRPYYLEPIGKSAKVYALLREAMLADGVTGVARVVMHTKEHLAALIATKDALVLNTMRWSADIRDLKDLTLPAAGKAGVKDAELKMARDLIDNMTTAWKPSDYDARFDSEIHKLVAQRVKAGKTAEVKPLEEAPQASNVIDLTALLKQSLAGRKGASKTVPKKAVAKEIPAKKRAPARKAA